MLFSYICSVRNFYFLKNGVFKNNHFWQYRS
nr:MAG TPA: hypothetical protein [Caudoviricetes sp.]